MYKHFLVYQNIKRRNNIIRDNLMDDGIGKKKYFLLTANCIPCACFALRTCELGFSFNKKIFTCSYLCLAVPRLTHLINERQ